MIPVPPQPHTEAGGRFSVMLAMLTFDSPKRRHESSILCRVLDGRELDAVCPIDAAIVSPGERARYLTVPHARQRALAFRARAELRRMLGREIGAPPQAVPLECDSQGKPRCPHPRAAGLDFSVSHADDCALIALGEADGIGVDAEWIPDRDPPDELLPAVFDDEEAAQWRSLPAPARPRAFTEAWTVKEAALKAQGRGMNGSPHDFSVRFTAGGRAEPLFREPNWICERLNFCPSYAACCVVILPSWENPRRSLAA